MPTNRNDEVGKSFDIGTKIEIDVELLEEERVDYDTM